MVGNCPCGNPIKDTKKAYACSNKECTFVIWKKIAGKNISVKMASNLLKYRKSGPFKGFISKKKKRFSASLVIIQKEGQWQVSFDFTQPESKEDSFSKTKKIPVPVEAVCPLCGGKIIEGKKGVGCANWRPEQGNCLFVIWNKISGKKLTRKNMETLLKGKTTRSYVLKDPKGNKFKAKLQMIQTSDMGFAITILPEENLQKSLVSPIPCSR